MELLNDFTTTVRKAFDEIDPKWESYDGLVVCGTHTPHNVEQTIKRIRVVREGGLPFLGICAGHQLAAVEYARNVLGHNAASEEWASVNGLSPLFPDPDFVVRKLPHLKVGLHDGESYWNNFEVVPGFEELWKKADNFITCQYHPEYQSSKDKPHPLLVKFLNLCKK